MLMRGPICGRGNMLAKVQSSQVFLAPPPRKGTSLPAYRVTGNIAAGPVSAKQSIYFSGKPSTRIYSERVHNVRQLYRDYSAPKPSEEPVPWQTEVHEISTQGSKLVRLRRYAPQNGSVKPLNTGPVMLFIPGLGSTPDGGEPFAEHGVNSPLLVYSLDRSYVLQQSVRFRFVKNYCKNWIPHWSICTKYPGSKKIYVSGFSLGGLLSAHLAARHPDKIARLCLISPTLLKPGSDRKRPG